MEREQIIKALECCKQDDCDNCPNDFGNCYSNLAGYALSLIKELTKDVERLRKQCGEAIVECDERDAERLKQVAELTVQLDAMRGATNSYKMHNERLTEENERLHASCTELTQNLHECKADTVRKMHSELYEEFLKVARCQKSGEPNMTSQEVLAILKRKSKEMEEENV